VEGIDKDDLYKELDQSGPYKRTNSGTLEREAMVVLKKIITKHTCINFRLRKEELMKKRLKAFKKQNWPEFQKLILLAKSEFQRLMVEVTQLAGEFLELDESTFEASLKEAMQDPSTLRTMGINDEMLRTEIDGENKTLTADLAKAIIIEKINIEFEKEASMTSVRPNSQHEADMIQLVERTKIADQLYLKHGYKLAELEWADKKFGIHNDPDVQAILKSHLALREQRS